MGDRSRRLECWIFAGSPGGIDRRRPEAHTDATDATGPAVSADPAWRPALGGSACLAGRGAARS